MANATRVACSDDPTAEEPSAQALYPGAGLGEGSAIAAPGAAAGGCTYVSDAAFTWGAKPAAARVRIPGGSLFADAALLSARGDARGPAAPGVLAYRVAGGGAAVLREAASEGLERHEALAGVRHAFSFSYVAGSCEVGRDGTPLSNPRLCRKG